MLSYKTLLDIDQFIRTHYDPSIPVEDGNASESFEGLVSDESFADPSDFEIDGFVRHERMMETAEQAPASYAQTPGSDFTENRAAADDSAEGINPENVNAFEPAADEPGSEFSGSEIKTAGKFSQKAADTESPVRDAENAEGDFSENQNVAASVAKTEDAEGPSPKIENAESTLQKAENAESAPQKAENAESTPQKAKSAEESLWTAENTETSCFETDGTEAPSDGETVQDDVVYLEPAAAHGSLFTKRRTIFGKLLAMVDGTARRERERAERYRNVPDDESGLTQTSETAAPSSDDTAFNAFGGDTAFDAFTAKSAFKERKYAADVSSDASLPTEGNVYAADKSPGRKDSSAGTAAEDSISVADTVTEGNRSVADTVTEENRSAAETVTENKKSSAGTFFAGRVSDTDVLYAGRVSEQAPFADRVSKAGAGQTPADSGYLQSVHMDFTRADSVHKDSVCDDSSCADAVCTDYASIPEMPSRSSKAINLDPDRRLRIDLDRRLRFADKGFADLLLSKIDASGLTDAQCYTRAQMNRSHFNRIKNDPEYHVMKRTVIALILALSLDRVQADELLHAAGYSLSNGSKSDIIVQYCIEKGIFDVIEVNELLYAYDQPLLGAGLRN